MNHVIVSLGSNIESDQNIEKAKTVLRQEYNVISESRFVVTKPVGPVKQADFVNGAVFLETELSANGLRTSLKRIESDLGRTQGSDPYGPRTIDLDIVVFNERIIDPDFHTRNYLKKSILELIPDLEY